MLDRWFGHNSHLYLHLFGLSGVAAGLPLNKVVLSISTMFLLLNVILAGNYKRTWMNIKNNRGFLLISALCVLHLIGFLWTNDIEYGLHDLRVKLPLIVIPLTIAAIPIYEKKQIHYLLIVFLSSVLITSVINFCMYRQWLGPRFYDDIRGMSIFVSHIRYALLVVMALAISIYFLLKGLKNFYFVVPIVWLSYYAFYSQVISGISSLLVLGTVLFVYFFWSRSKLLVVAFVTATSAVTVMLFMWLFEPVQINLEDYKGLDKFTSEGHMYVHDLNFISPETKKPIGLFSCDPELKREWNKRSDIDYFGHDVKGQPVQQTLKRFLASKDLRKDAKGIEELSNQEIKLIEHGCASQYCHGLMARLYGLKYQLINEDNPNGHSFLQRVEFWKAGAHITSENAFFGVGTGDVQQAFDDYYNNTDSPLDESNRNRAHNMYLTIIISFGIIGLFVFGWLHIYFLKLNIKSRNLIALLFISIVLTSYLMEDTLETQVGVTFFAFFYALFTIPPYVNNREEGSPPIQ